MSNNTPKSAGFTFPAEWYPHEATWLSWPHNKESWPGKISKIYQPYCEFIKEVANGERVCINVKDQPMQDHATEKLIKAGANLDRITFYHHPTNDAWCRDHGPAFVINPQTGEKAIVDWGYNAWGGKYPPFDLDNQIPSLVADKLGLATFHPGIVMEGGSVDFNGKGIVLTTTACLLNKNRNPHLSKEEISEYLINYYGVDTIWWLGDGIEGDDTDGHIDDITRFTAHDTVVTVVEPNKKDPNHFPLAENLAALKKLRVDDKPLNVVELPMPKPVIYRDQRLPASYANFYIANHAVIVPTYRDDAKDKEALDLLSQLFTDRKVVGIDSTDIVWGLGSFHCLSQQEPKV
ncbi:MAG: agmatine deiminase family protein [Cyclobacteriaceae bacterium]